MRTIPKNVGFLFASAAFIPTLLVVGSLAAADGDQVVPRYSVHDVTLSARKSFENPFVDADVSATFRRPSGTELTVGGFHDGGSNWKVRITPDETGTWTYTTKCIAGDPGLNARTGSFRVVESSAPGFIRIDPERPTTFRFDNGDWFFPMGDTAYKLLVQDEKAIREFFEIRRRSRFNFVRVIVVCDPRFWLFGGDPQKPDFTRFNIETMRKLDRVFETARACGMNLELIIYGYDPLNVSLWTDVAAQDRLVDYLVRRYAAFPNLFLWDVANEFERYADGRYRFEPSDVGWARSVCARIRARDAFGHPTGVHCSHWTTETGGLRYRDHVNGPFQSVWPLWSDANEVTTFVTQNNTGLEVPERKRRHNPGDATVLEWQGDAYRRTWTAAGWEFEAAGLEDFIADDWARGKPVLNLEFGYQYEPGTEEEFSYTTRQSHSFDSTRRKMWKIAASGGYFAAGFSSSWSGAADKSHAFDIQNWRPQCYEVLYDFFVKRTDYWRMAPHLELVPKTDACLADPGREYVVYAPRGGRVSVEIAAGTYTTRWLNPTTGATLDAKTTTGPAALRMESPLPDGQDVVLHLEAVVAR
jgi:hypothetical protein